jgi:hypothetical protein
MPDKLVMRAQSSTRFWRSPGSGGGIRRRPVSSNPLGASHRSPRCGCAPRRPKHTRSPCARVCARERGRPAGGNRARGSLLGLQDPKHARSPGALTRVGARVREGRNARACPPIRSHKRERPSKGQPPCVKWETAIAADEAYRPSRRPQSQPFNTPRDLNRVLSLTNETMT